MAGKEETAEIAGSAAPPPAYCDDRIDDFATKGFQELGYAGRLPDTMVSLYKAFKRFKDRLQPGRLSPEGFAFIATLTEMIDGDLLKKKD